MKSPACRPSCSSYKSTRKKSLCALLRAPLIEISRKRVSKSALRKRNKNKGPNQPTKYKSLGVSPL